MVVDREEPLAQPPRQLPVSNERPEPAYELVDDMVAVHGEPDAPSLANATVRLDDGIAVVPKAEAGRLTRAQSTVGPVYRRVPGGSLAVPTGRVLVRYTEGDAAENHRDELAAARYEIDDALSYAPHTAWVRASSGDIADTLARLDELAALPGAVHVEAQMVGEVARRG